MLPQLEKIKRRTNLFTELKGKRVGVDAFVWMHQLCLHFREEVIQNKDHDGVIKAFVERAARLQERSVYPVLVFDSEKRMPGKTEVDAARAKRRAKALAYIKDTELKTDTKEYESSLAAAMHDHNTAARPRHHSSTSPCWICPDSGTV